MTQETSPVDAGQETTASIEASPSIQTTDIAFTDLNLSAPILKAIEETGYTNPTPIQSKAIPIVLKGGDLLAGAQTGTGKTAGFTLPILHILSEKPKDVKKGQPRCLMLTPTRELAAQIQESVVTYGKHLPLTSTVIFGGVNINPQINRLKTPLDIVVATPGRLLDHAGQKTIDLSEIEILVLDEADRMLDMGFIHDIKKILKMLPKERQNLLFSATFADEIKTLADTLLNKPDFVEVARRNTASELVEQTVHMVPQGNKRALVSHLITTNDWQQVLVFTRTKHGANRLTEKLIKDDITAAAIHGNKSQGARTKALAGFKDGTVRVLVATDIAARGLDIDQLPQVVNFELPNVPEDYVHRIGRTGRAGSSGAAVSLVDREEVKLLKDIEKLIKRQIPKVPVEGFTPPEVLENDDRAPRPRNNRSSKPSNNNNRNRKPAKNGSERSPQNGRNGDNRNANNAGSQGQNRNNQQSARKPRTESDANLSEAARHQAMPQASLFVPPQPQRRPRPAGAAADPYGLNKTRSPGGSGGGRNAGGRNGTGGGGQGPNRGGQSRNNSGAGRGGGRNTSR